VVLTRHPVRFELAGVGFLDGDAFVVAAVVGADDDRLLVVVGPADGLQQKLAVRLVHADVQVVAALLGDGGQLGVALVAPHLELEHIARIVHDHRRRLHALHGRSVPEKTSLANSDTLRPASGVAAQTEALRTVCTEK
jgi:hypothetical protein